jgi:hypothetical protein
MLSGSILTKIALHYDDGRDKGCDPPAKLEAKLNDRGYENVGEDTSGVVKDKIKGAEIVARKQQSAAQPQTPCAATCNRS